MTLIQFKASKKMDLQVGTMCYITYAGYLTPKRKHALTREPIGVIVRRQQPSRRGSLVWVCAYQRA